MLKVLDVRNGAPIRNCLSTCAEIVLWRSVTFCNIRCIDYFHLPMSPIRFPVISLENVVLYWNPVVILFVQFYGDFKLHVLKWSFNLQISSLIRLRYFFLQILLADILSQTIPSFCAELLTQWFSMEPFWLLFKLSRQCCRLQSLLF